MSGLRRWTPDEDAHLRRRWAAGDTARAIAADVGRTRDAVCERANRLGLKHPHPPGRRPATTWPYDDHVLDHLCLFCTRCERLLADIAPDRLRCVAPKSAAEPEPAKAAA